MPLLLKAEHRFHWVTTKTLNPPQADTLSLRINLSLLHTPSFASLHSISVSDHGRRRRAPLSPPPRCRLCLILRLSLGNIPAASLVFIYVLLLVVVAPNYLDFSYLIRIGLTSFMVAVVLFSLLKILLIWNTSVCFELPVYCFCSDFTLSCWNFNSIVLLIDFQVRFLWFWDIVVNPLM